MKEQNFIYDDSNIRDLAPRILKENKKYKTVLAVIDALISKHIISNIPLLQFLERIDEMSEEELDLVANELSVDFYDFSISIKEKRKLCKQSFSIHAIKGTNGAIQNTLNIFYRDSRIVEFPEFSGANGTFKIEIQGTLEDNLEKMISRVDVVKKKSQHLAGIVFKSESNCLLENALHIQSGTTQKLLPQPIYIHLNNIDLKTKSGHYTELKGGL